jgi:hypothetical protein
MTRVLSSVCVVLLALVLGGLGSRAWAGGKPPIAILGLEVYDNGSGIDPETTRAAKELTAALRDRAKAGTGPYTPVGGEKELIDEKLINNCDSEAPTCMAAIGTELGAEVLMYGKIEKSTQNGQGIYKVSIKLLSVGRKQLSSSTVETLPITESTGIRATTHAKAWYAKLAGGVSGGTLTIKANIDRGTVLLDDETRGNLASGALTLSGVSEGRHTIAIEAKDYQRYESQITVRSGETTTQSVTMVEMSRKPTSAKEPRETISREGTVTVTKRNVWKPIFYGTLAADAAAAGFTIFAWHEANTKAPPGGSNSQCGSGQASNLNSACNWYTAHVVGWVVSGVLGAAVVGSFVMAYVRDSGESDTKTTARGRHKRREVAITPVVTPEGGGATLRFDW